MLGLRDLGKDQPFTTENKPASGLLRLIKKGCSPREIVEILFSQESRQKKQAIEKYLYDHEKYLSQIVNTNEYRFNCDVNGFYEEVVLHKVDILRLHTGHSFSEPFTIQTPCMDYFWVPSSAKVIDEKGQIVTEREVKSSEKTTYQIRSSWILMSYINVYGILVTELHYTGKIVELEELKNLVGILLSL